MTPQQQMILGIVRQVHRATCAPVTAVAVATHYCMCDRHVRRYLNGLEKAGVIYRVGQRRGWVPAV